MDIEQALVGKTIEHAEIDVIGESICFHLKGGKSVVLDVEAECCSYTWIESIDAPHALLGTVTSVERIDMPEGSISRINPDCNECLQYYGLKITTTSGIAVIDYRNDSNGYYGGDLFVRKQLWEAAS